MSEYEKEKKDKIHMKRTWVKTPTIYQMEATECGAASLAMILAYYGKFVPLEQMRIETGVSRDGCNARNICNAARKFGLNCNGFTKDIDALIYMSTPCLIHWNFNHFVVFEGVKNGHPYINDPAIGRRKLTMQELDDAFTGIVLTFEKNTEFARTKKKSSVSGLIRSRLKNEIPTLIALLLIGILLVIPGLVIPIFSQVFVDDILLGGNASWLGALLLAMIGTTLFNVFFTWLREHLLINLQVKMSLISAYSFLKRMFCLPITFFEQRYSGELSERISNNNNVNAFLAGELAENVLNVFVAVFYLILLLIYSPLLTLIGVMGVALTITVSVILSRSLSTLSIKGQQDSGKRVGTFYNGLSITSTLKASGAESEYVARILGHYARGAEIEQRIGKMQQILLAAPSVFSQISSIVVLMLGGNMIIKGDITAGMLVAFSQLLSSFTTPVNALAGFFQKIQTLKADINCVNDIEQYQIASQFQPDQKRVEMNEKLSGQIELKNVSFGYSTLNAPLIKDFSFKVNPGHTVAFVGTSGCGKSTVSKLINGLMDPWEGEVLFDGIPLRMIPPEVVCASITTVSQSITLFSGTIRDNLTLWNPLAMEQDIVQAAKDACIHDTITKLPGAYDYHLAESGSNLSGGQRQRLEIARALVTNPSILIMDESTSALDPIVEKRVMDNIRRRGCTCVIVAHRLSTIRDCDEIIIMKQGKIVQRGTHEEMCGIEGPYHTLIKA